MPRLGEFRIHPGRRFCEKYQLAAPERYPRVREARLYDIPAAIIGPFADILSCEPRMESQATDGTQLSEDRIAVISDLVSQIVYQARGFKFHPPKAVTDDPDVLKSEGVIERLADSKFWLRLGDGREELLTLPELLALAYNLYGVRKQLQRAKQDLKAKGVIRLSINFDVVEMMKLDNARPL